MITGKQIGLTGAAGNLERPVVRALIDQDLQLIGGTSRPDDTEG